MKHLRYYSLLAFGITLGFLVFGVEDAKERQKHLLSHLAIVTDEINTEAKSLPPLIIIRCKILGIDRPNLLTSGSQGRVVENQMMHLDSSGVYKKYHSARLGYEHLKNTFNALPVPDSEWNYIAVMKDSREIYALNESISSTFDILRVTTAPDDIQLHAFIDNAPVSKPMSGFQLRSDDKVDEIQVYYENPFTCEPHYISQKFD